VLSAAAGGDPLPRRAIESLNAASARSVGYVRLRVQRGTPRAELAGSGTPLDRALSTIARSAIELLASPDRERLRVCPAPSCGMFYLGGSDQGGAPCRAGTAHAPHATTPADGRTRPPELPSG